MSQPEPSEPFALPRQRGFLGWVERVGNLLPEPTMIFVYLFMALMVRSTIGAALGWSASLAYAGETAPTGAVLADGRITYQATSLFSSENIGLKLNPRASKNAFVWEMSVTGRLTKIMRILDLLLACDHRHDERAGDRST